MMPSIPKPSTREEMLTSTRLHATLGKQTVNDSNLQAGPKIVKVEFNKYIDNSVNTQMKAVKPAYVTKDEALFREITSKFYSKGTNLRSMFNQISRLSTMGEAPLYKEDPHVITLAQFRSQLQTWGLHFAEGQLRRFFQTFEERPGTGLTYAGFVQLVAEMNEEEVAGNRLLNLYLMERFEAADKNGPLASTCLLPSQTQAEGITKLRSKRKPLYGTQCGLDVNFDGTNNGHY
uniref:Uncharacterized protein n=1 Tax=Eutreptiella gymnastica TaxID=73025 RepID=A0A7S1HXD2_9EUGL|mmetsp:Transcript_112537/g.195455  ORF Transcript_112537/g.195455 Transcript_112537/m.195455 type:complete len:233 (+) Transcript_112537:118-816(+)